MVTRDQANLIGDALIEQARNEELAWKNAAAAAVPWMYRFPELEALQRWERPILVAEARRYAMRQPKVIALWAVLSAVLLSLAFAFIKLHLPSPVLTVCLSTLILLAPVYFYRREVMRTYIRNAVATSVGRTNAREH